MTRIATACTRLFLAVLLVETLHSAQNRGWNDRDPVVRREQ